MKDRILQAVDKAENVDLYPHLTPEMRKNLKDIAYKIGDWWRSGGGDVLRELITNRIKMYEIEIFDDNNTVDEIKRKLLIAKRNECKSIIDEFNSNIEAGMKLLGKEGAGELEHG